MHSDDFNQFHVDLERMERLCCDGHCAPEGCRTVRTDRTHSAGRFGDGAVVVAVSAAEKWSWLRPIAGEVIVVPPIGRFSAFQFGGSKCGRFDDCSETLASLKQADLRLPPARHNARRRERQLPASLLH